MTKKLFIISFLTLLLLFTNKTFSQQTNSNEDYSAYLPEVRAVNKYLASMPQGASVLTKKGLEAARNEMPTTPVAPPPSVKYILGPAGNIAVRIFKPDTIRAV